MTAQGLIKAIKEKKPAIIEENGSPRYVILDWKTYRAWEEMREDMEDHIRFDLAEQASRGRKRYTIGEIKKKHNLP